MRKIRMLTQFGQGTSLRRQDYTQAAIRAARDALWHNSINLAELFGCDRSEMLIEVEIGVAAPERVDVAAVAGVFPYGEVSVTAVKGGLDVPRTDGKPPTVIAVAAISVSFQMEGV